LVHSTGVRRSIIIQNEQIRISDEEAAARLEKLQYLKLKPRDEEVNRLQILRGERLYEEIPEKAGVEANVDIYPDCFHAFDMLLPFKKVSKKAIATFEQQYLYACENYFAEQKGSNDSSLL